MQHPLLLALFVLGICLLLIFYFVSSAFYKRKHETKYHFYQMFPYEFNYPGFFKFNVYGNLVLFLAFFSVIAFYEINPLKSIYSIIGIVLSIVLTMLFIILVLFPIRYLRTHMIVSAVAMTLSAALPMFNFFEAFDQYKLAIEQPNKVLCVISMVVSGLLALTMLLLILNPKLTFKIYYDKAVDEKGNEIVKRPKVIYMALNEWWAIVIFFLSPLALIFLLIL